MHEPYSEVDYEEFFLQCGGHTKAVSVLGQVRRNTKQTPLLGLLKKVPKKIIVTSEEQHCTVNLKKLSII